jgi:hypothetical protein
MIVEVDVEPFTPGAARLVHRNRDELLTDPSPAGIRGDNRVQDERVDAPVPGDVDEADEILLLPCADPAEAVALDLAAPVVVQQRMLERVCVSAFSSAFANAPRQRYTGSICRTYSRMATRSAAPDGVSSRGGAPPRSCGRRSNRGSAS